MSKVFNIVFKKKSTVVDTDIVLEYNSLSIANSFKVILQEELVNFFKNKIPFSFVMDIESTRIKTVVTDFFDDFTCVGYGLYSDMKTAMTGAMIKVDDKYIFECVSVDLSRYQQ